MSASSGGSTQKSSAMGVACRRRALCTGSPGNRLMPASKRWQAAALAVVVALFEASLRRRNATIAIDGRVQQLGAPRLLQQTSQVLPCADFRRRERAGGPPRPEES